MTGRTISQAEQPNTPGKPSPGAQGGTAPHNLARAVDANIQRRLITVDEAMALGAMGRTKFYELAADGRFVVRKLGSATRVDRASFEAYLDGLPAASFGTPKRSAA